MTRSATIREFETFEDYLDVPESLRPELTLEDYLALPVTSRRLEVIDGVIAMSPTPTFWHQELILRLATGITAFAAPRGLGKIVLSPADVLIRTRPNLRTRQPDLLFLGSAKLAGLDFKKIHVLPIAPDLVVEVASPSDRPGAWSEKLADYASIGVPEVWRADPAARTVEVLALGSGGYARAGLHGAGEAVASAVLPGLQLPVGPLFE